MKHNRTITSLSAERRRFFFFRGSNLCICLLGIFSNVKAQDQKKAKQIPHPTRRKDNEDSSSIYNVNADLDMDVDENVNDKESVTTSSLAPFDKDIRSDCRSLLEFCQSDIYSHLYLQCPAMCTKYLEQEGMKGTSDNTDALWEVGSIRTILGNRIEADRFEGYVLVFAILPMLPGMAKYYYEMMETLHEKFNPKVEFVILPIDVGEGIHIKLRHDSKVILFEEDSAIESHPWIKHLSDIKPRSGAATKNHRDEVVQLEIPTDRLTVYIISADGYFVERMTVPTMAVLQRTIGMYLRTMDYDEL